MSDSVIIYLSNFEKGVMRAWINPQASEHSEYIEERNGGRVKPWRIVNYGFMGKVQKGYDTLGNTFTRMKGPII